MSKKKSEIVLHTNVSEAGREEASSYQSIIGDMIPRPLELKRHFISIEDVNNIRTIVYASGTSSTAFYDWSELMSERGVFVFLYRRPSSTRRTKPRTAMSVRINGK